ncbi:hypothetical protein EG329_008626 [Mollisiaceae sp. DMI_Dod_QoI]|nr:hypothetical protein EG329_008626 [Helotiales sp. DMI_Dod_QoI]
MHCIKTNQSAYDVISISFISAWLVFAFLNRIVNICYKQSISERSWLFEYVVLHFKLEPEGESQKWHTDRERLDERLAKLPERRTAVQDLVYCVALLLFFLEDIMGTLTWTNCSQPTDNSDSCWPKVLEMGLGQIIPLILLTLPAFAFLESFAEAHESNGVVGPNTAKAIASKAGEAIDLQADKNPTKNTMADLLATSVMLAQSTHRAQELAHNITERSTICRGQNLYNTFIGKWIAFALYVYFFLLFIAAAVLAGGVGASKAGLIIVLFLVLATYFLGAAVECSMLTKAFKRRRTRRRIRDRGNES